MLTELIEAEMTNSSSVPDEVMELIKKLPDFERRHKLMDASYRECLERHPYQWVALLEGDIWVLADSFDSLYKSIDEQGLQREGAVVCYLDPNPPKVKL